MPTFLRIVSVFTCGIALACGSPRERAGGPDDLSADELSGKLSYCAPRPQPRTLALPPDLFSWIVEAELSGCHLVDRQSEGLSGGFPIPQHEFEAPGTSTCDGADCWVSMPSVARAWDQMPPLSSFGVVPGPNGEQWIAMIAPARHQDTGHVRATLTAMKWGSSSQIQFDVVFTADGRVLEERQTQDGQAWFRITREYDGGNLVASVHTDWINGGGETSFSWTYDGEGRLGGAIAMHENTGRVSDASYTYDSNGRLASVTRTVDGQVWFVEQWGYTDGVLSTTDIEFFASLYSSVQQITDVNTSAPLIYGTHQGEWEASLLMPDGDCATLPHSLLHGYPAADGAYDLGWPVGDRPDGIDKDYGYNNFFDNAVHRWYGLDRVEPFAFGAPIFAPVAVIHRSYDKFANMLTESVTTSDLSLKATRTRKLIKGRVVADEREKIIEQGTLNTALELAYDAAGRLETRVATLNDVVVGKHHWDYDGEGRIVRNGAASHAIAAQNFASMFIPDVSSLPDALPGPVIHEREFSDDGLEVSFKRAGAVTEIRTLDVSGRLVQLEKFGATSVYEYSESGQQLSFSSDDQTDGSVDVSVSVELADDGRLVQRGWVLPQGTDTDLFTYVCN